MPLEPSIEFALKCKVCHEIVELEQVYKVINHYFPIQSTL